MAQTLAPSRRPVKTAARSIDPFLVAITPDELTAVAGGGACVTAILPHVDDEPVRFTLKSPLPGISLAKVTGFGSARTLFLSVAASVAPATYPLTVTVTKGDEVRTAAIFLAVALFDVRLEPSAVVVSEGSSVALAVTVLRAPTFVAPVSLQLDEAGLVQGLFLPNPTLSDSSLLLSVHEPVVKLSRVRVYATAAEHTCAATVKLLPDPDASAS